MATLQEIETIMQQDTRELDVKLDIYFDGPELSPTPFDREVVASLTLLEEITGKADNPLGGVTSNELSFELDNSDRVFAYSNETSPYFGKIKPRVMVKAYINVITYDDPLIEGDPLVEVIDVVPLGIFWVDDWGVSSTSVTANVTAYDMLYFLSNEPFVGLRVMKNTSIGDLFEELFGVLGLIAAQYNIDASFYATTLDYGWVPKRKIMDALQSLAIAGAAHVYVDRLGVLQVKPIGTTRIDFDVTWTDDTQVMYLDIPTDYANTYSKVMIKRFIPQIKPNQQLANVKSLELPAGTNEFIFELNGPVAKIDYVRLPNTDYATVDYVRFDTWNAVVGLNNPEIGAINSDVIIAGTLIDGVYEEHTLSDAPMLLEIGERLFTVESVLIQDPAVAGLYAITLIDILSDPERFIKLTARGNPMLAPGHIILLQDSTNKVTNKRVYVQKQTLIYDGGLEVDIEGILLPYGE